MRLAGGISHQSDIQIIFLILGRKPSKNGTNMVKRRFDTWRCAKLIHGGSEAKKGPALHGLFDTVATKDTVHRFARRIVSSKVKTAVGAREVLKDEFLTAWARSFQKSKDNVKRSLNMMYSHCPTGYRKYEGMRKAGKQKFNGVNVPNLVPWEDLKKVVDAMDIGELKDINPDLTTGIYHRPR